MAFESNSAVTAQPRENRSTLFGFSHKEERIMKVISSLVRISLCTGLLLGSVAFGHAQEPASQPASPAVDNTKMNQRDQNKNEPTADQQKDNRTDLDITQRIRQSIMYDKSLSTYAHNVKIITQNGQVTLKGPVRSEGEKQAIETKATEVAGANKVTNDLNIKQ
jgi:hyperosmotically inducible periplasmic protein